MKHAQRICTSSRAAGQGLWEEGRAQGHLPVLLSEVVEAFEGRTLRVFVDATLGNGGHADAILKSHPEIELYIGMDDDPSALELSKERLRPFAAKTKFVHGNFRNYESIVGRALDQHLPPGGGGVDGILADLGMSSMQVDSDARGFSFMRTGPLDMRMNPGASLSAWNVVNEYSEHDIGTILKDFGEERHWKRLARAIVLARADGPIETTTELAQVVARNSPGRKKRNPTKGTKGIHPATRAFQAIRIAVNGELEAIDKGLPAMVKSLRSGGRMAVVSFHSLEDRRVKHTFQKSAGIKSAQGTVTKLERYSGIRASPSGQPPPVLSLPRRKPVLAKEEEIQCNPRSRSAKLRIADKV